MNNREAYQALTEARVHWDRKDGNHIIVWTSGYLTAECHEIERFLMQAKMRAVSQEFDKVCGKTVTTYKHKETV